MIFFPRIETIWYRAKLDMREVCGIAVRKHSLWKEQLLRLVTGSSFAAGCSVWGISCLVLLPSPCNDSSLCLSFSNICKATAVTHTKQIDRNLLRKETSFVFYTSSVLRKSRHMKQKEKITHCCWDQNSRLQKLSTIATPPLNTATTVCACFVSSSVHTSALHPLLLYCSFMFSSCLCMWCCYCFYFMIVLYLSYIFLVLCLYCVWHYIPFD